MNQVKNRADAIRIQLYVLPTALVAWADGCLDADERAMLEKIASQLSPEDRSAESRAPREWLERIPTQDEVEGWVWLVRKFLPRISAFERESFVARTKCNLWLVAGAAGGPRVCAKERAVIARISQILHSAAA